MGCMMRISSNSMCQGIVRRRTTSRRRDPAGWVMVIRFHAAFAAHQGQLLSYAMQSSDHVILASLCIPRHHVYVVPWARDCHIRNTPQSPPSPSAPISPRPPGPLADRDARSSAARSSPRPSTSRVSEGAMIPSSCTQSASAGVHVPISWPSSTRPCSAPQSRSGDPSTGLHRLLDSVCPIPSASPRTADRGPSPISWRWAT